MGRKLQWLRHRHPNNATGRPHKPSLAPPAEGDPPPEGLAKEILSTGAGLQDAKPSPTALELQPILDGQIRKHLDLGRSRQTHISSLSVLLFSLFFVVGYIILLLGFRHMEIPFFQRLYSPEEIKSDDQKSL